MSLHEPMRTVLYSSSLLYMRPGAHAVAASRQSAAEDEDDDLCEDEDEDLLEGVHVGVEAEFPCETFTFPQGLQSMWEDEDAISLRTVECAPCLDGAYVLYASFFCSSSIFDVCSAGIDAPPQPLSRPAQMLHET